MSGTLVKDDGKSAGNVSVFTDKPTVTEVVVAPANAQIVDSQTGTSGNQNGIKLTAGGDVVVIKNGSEESVPQFSGNPQDLRNIREAINYLLGE